MYRANQDIRIVHAVGPAFDKGGFELSLIPGKTSTFLVAVNGCGWCSEATQRE